MLSLKIWLTDTELRNVSAQYNPMTLGDLQTNLFNMVNKSLQEYLGHLLLLSFVQDWVKYFNGFFSKAGVTIPMPFTRDSVVIVDTPTYFSGLQHLTSRSRLEVRDMHTMFSNIVYSFSDYARWQLLLNEAVYSTASLQSSWTIMHERRFPKSYKLSESASFACVELAESSMPLAVARPFVDELITNTTIDKVIGCCFLNDVLYCCCHAPKFAKEFNFCLPLFLNLSIFNLCLKL